MKRYWFRKIGTRTTYMVGFLWKNSRFKLSVTKDVNQIRIILSKEVV